MERKKKKKRKGRKEKDERGCYMAGGAGRGGEKKKLEVLRAVSSVLSSDG